MSAEKALLKFSAKHARQNRRMAERRNGKPEMLVQRAVLQWLSSNGFSCQSVESKAVYSARLGRYLHSQANPGTSDILGTGPGGLAVYIEIKAPGRLSTLRPKQRAFLLGKIQMGAFGFVTDSVERLIGGWEEFERRRALSSELAKAYLLRQLPKAKEESKGSENLFSEGGTGDQ